MNDDDPQHPKCFPCRRKRCLGCQWRWRRTSCSCDCGWLVADMLASFPSLRRQLIEETRMTQPIDEDEYAEDAATVPSDDLPEPTDPSQVPPDEGDAGAAK